MAQKTYPTDASALIVIDPLNDFLSERGKVYNNIKSKLERVQLNEHSFDDFKYITPRLQVAMQNHVFWEGDFEVLAWYENGWITHGAQTWRCKTIPWVCRKGPQSLRSVRERHPTFVPIPRYSDTLPFG